jgi:hypothetical protein
MHLSTDPPAGLAREIVTRSVAAVGLAGFVLTRTVGLPQAPNWSEPLGLAALFVEGAVIAVAGYALAALRPPRRLARRNRMAPADGR